MTKPKEERRKKPRARGAPGLTVGVKSQAPSADIRDISLSGVRFAVDEPIEFMTRLIMTLVVPGADASSDETAGGVHCEGAVVRCEPMDSGENSRYEVAVFFTQLDETAKKAIEEYVQTHENT